MPMPYFHFGLLHRTRSQPDRNGFSFIELLVAITVLVILATIAIWAVKQWLVTTEVRTSANDLVSVLELAQSKAISAEEASPYTVCGLVLVNPKNIYRITRGETCASSEVSRHTFPGKVKFTLTMNVPPSGNEWMIVFEKLTGRARLITPNSVGTITLADTPSGLLDTVTVTSAGIISHP